MYAVSVTQLTNVYARCITMGYQWLMRDILGVATSEPPATQRTARTISVNITSHYDDSDDSDDELMDRVIEMIQTTTPQNDERARSDAIKKAEKLGIIPEWSKENNVEEGECEDEELCPSCMSKKCTIYTVSCEKPHAVGCLDCAREYIKTSHAKLKDTGMQCPMCRTLTKFAKVL